jgi:hypothetical protein
VAPRSVKACTAAGHQSLDFGLRLGAAQVRAIGQAQPGDAVVEAMTPIHGAVFGGVPVAAVGPGQFIEHQRRVSHIARQGAARRQGGVGAGIGDVGNPPEGRLDAEQSGKAGRYADRAAAVGAVGDGADARRQGRRAKARAV